MPPARSEPASAVRDVKNGDEGVHRRAERDGLEARDRLLQHHCRRQVAVRRCRCEPNAPTSRASSTRTSSNGSTNWDDAFVKTLNVMDDATRDDLVLFVTDGDPTNWNKTISTAMERLRPMAKLRGPGTSTTPTSSPRASRTRSTTRTSFAAVARTSSSWRVGNGFSAKSNNAHPGDLRARRARLGGVRWTGRPTTRASASTCPGHGAEGARDRLLRVVREGHEAGGLGRRRTVRRLRRRVDVHRRTSTRCVGATRGGSRSGRRRPGRPRPRTETRPCCSTGIPINSQAKSTFTLTEDVAAELRVRGRGLLARRPLRQPPGDDRDRSDSPPQRAPCGTSGCPA